MLESSALRKLFITHVVTLAGASIQLKSAKVLKPNTMKALVLLAVALTLTTTHAQPQQRPIPSAVLTNAVERLNSSSLVKYLTTYAIGAVDKNLSDDFTRSILATYPQLIDVRTAAS